MLNRNLKKQFEARAKRIEQARKSIRFRQVIGKLKKGNYLIAPDYNEFPGPVDLEDVLWAAQYEKRILEVLPGILKSRPKFLRVRTLPTDLEQVIRKLDSTEKQPSFRGVLPEKYMRWVKRKSKLKNYRFTDSELFKLAELSQVYGSEIGVLREAIKLLYNQNFSKDIKL